MRALRGALHRNGVVASLVAFPGWRVRVTLLLFSLGACLAEGAAPPHPRLLFGREEIPSWTARLATPVGQAMHARFDALMDENRERRFPGDRAAGHALRHRLSGEARWAERAGAEAQLLLPVCSAAPKLRIGPDGDPAADALYLAQVMELALAYDWCGDWWPANVRQAVADALAMAVRQALPGTRLRPGQTMVSREVLQWRATAGVAALAVADDARTTAGFDGLAKVAATHVRLYLDSCGGQGWPPEGFSAVRTLLGGPLAVFLQAWRIKTGEDLFASTPARGWVGLYAAVIVPPSDGDFTLGPKLPFFGNRGWRAAVSDGQVKKRDVAAEWSEGAFAGGDFARLLLLSDAASRSALQKIFDRCFGLAGDRSCDVRQPIDLAFALMGYPFAEAPIDPGTVLSRVWRDDRAGVVIQRSGWVGAADAVAAITANSRPVRGLDSYADAGSFRLLALGGRWAVQRLRDPFDVDHVQRDRENVVVVPGTHGWFGGTLTHAQFQPDGSGTTVLDLNAPYWVAPGDGRPQRLERTADLGLRVQRTWAVDYSGACGAPVLAVVVDRMTSGPLRRWQMHTAEREIQVLPEGFRLAAANGATLLATVIAPAKPKLRLDRGQWTDTIAIEGDGDFFVVMTVQPAGTPAPQILRKGIGLETRVKVGGTELYYDGRWVGMQ